VGLKSLLIREKYLYVVYEGRDVLEVIVYKVEKTVVKGRRRFRLVVSVSII